MIRLIELGQNPTSILVPACHDCNVHVSTRTFNSFGEKRDFIRESIRERHQSLLAISYDLDELIYENDKVILEKIETLRKKDEVIRRLNFQHSYDLNQICTNTHVLQDTQRECPNCHKFVSYVDRIALQKAKIANKPCRKCWGVANCLRATNCMCSCIICNTAFNHTFVHQCEGCNSSKRVRPMTCSNCSRHKRK